VIRMGLKLEGKDKLLAELRDLRRRAPDAYAAAVYLAGTNVMSTSLKLVPVETGHLRKTRYVTRPTFDGLDRFAFELGYSAPYAVFVHEINKRYYAGEWKFLRRAAEWHAPRLPRDIASWTARFMAKGIPPPSAHHPETPFVGPVPPRLGSYRAKNAGEKETKKARARRLAKNRKTQAKRDAGRAKNRERMIAEASAYVEAIAAGRRPPRPGRGG